jgi:acetyltransferase-like isoleucine patch superfamily enzyme
MTNYRADYLSFKSLGALPFKSIGEDVLIHERAMLVGVENIAIGSHVRIDADVELVATGELTIGCYSHIAAGVFIAAKGGFEMENFANISHGACIYTVNDDYSGEYLMGPTVPAELRRVAAARVRLEEYSAIGAGSVVLPGVILAEGSVLGALSLLRESTQPWTIYGGIPARLLKRRERGVIAKGQRLAPTST